MRVRETLGQLNLVDARNNPLIMEEITARGWDIDEGMVLRVDSELYYGSEAIHMLSLLGSHSGVFNRLNYWAFHSPKRAKVLYPILKSCRGVLLKLLGRCRINNLEIDGKERF